MAKRVRDTHLESRTARSKLPQRGKPYYTAIGPGLHVGYRKGKTGGVWVARLYKGEQDYLVQKVGVADDFLDADGTAILNFWQAQAAARAFAVLIETPPRQPTWRRSPSPTSSPPMWQPAMPVTPAVGRAPFARTPAGVWVGTCSAKASAASRKQLPPRRWPAWRCQP